MRGTGGTAIRRRVVLGLAAFLFGVAGCGRSGIAPLPAVSPLPNPKVPAWIEQISPIGEADPLTQIRIRFKRPLIPVEAIESPEQQGKLTYFSVTPALPGHFRFLTPRMVGFQADQALPISTRIQVTVRTGLTDLQNNHLDHDIAWTFTTPAVELGNLPELEEYTNPVGPQQTFQISANTELDPASLALHGRVTAKGMNPVGVSVKPSKQTPSPWANQPYQRFDPSAKPWLYDVTPRTPLAGGKTYTLEFAPGIMPARGNLASTASFSGEFKVYGPLAFERLGYEEGSTVGRFSGPPKRLEFNNPVVADSAIKNITFSPAPQAGVAPFYADGESRYVWLNETAFQPATTYTITLGAALKDVFGQALGQQQQVAYRTGNLTPAVWAPGQFFIFPSADNLQLDLWAVNLPRRTFTQAFASLAPVDLVYIDPSGDNVAQLLTQWTTVQAAGAVNEGQHFSVPLRQQLGGQTGLLAYGVRADVGQSSGASVYGAVQLTNLGIFAQWFPESGIVRVHHLSDGSPAAGARVEVWPSRTDDNRITKNVSYCASAQTDASGTALFDAASLHGCMNGSVSFGDPPSLLTVAREGNDWAFTRTLEYSGAYDYDLNAEWGNGPASFGTIFTDRQLYQPGESGWLTGEMYYLKRGVLTRGANTTYKVSLFDPNGATIDLGSATTNAYGTFSLQVHFKKTQPLGYYTVEAIGPNKEKIDGTLRVAEFKPPNFKVELSLDKQFANAGQTVAATAKSSYLFGAPVQGGTYKFYVTRQQTSFSPKGWDDYAFGRQWLWPDEPPSVPSDVTQSNGTLGADGSSNLNVSVAGDLPYPMAYRVDMETTDASNLSVADSKTFTALPGDSLIGLTGDFLAQTGVAYPVKVIVTDPQGKPKEGERVHITLAQVKYNSVTELVAGSTNERWQAEYKTVAEMDVRSATSPQTVTLTPPQSGIYRVRANLAGARDDATATDLIVWAAGADLVNWGNENPDRLTIKLDKKTYKPGDTATVLVESPYPAGELYLSVVRYKTLYHSVVKVKGGAPRVTFTVTPDMIPNAAVEAVLVRQGAPLSQSVPESLDSLSRVGFAPLSASLDGRRLQVTLAPAKAKLEPGQQQTVQFSMRDAQGRPVQGEFTIMVVNEAILQLTGYRPPDLLTTVFAAEPIPTRFSDNRPNVVLRPFASPIQKGWGFGGGLSEAAAGTRIRTNFQPLAYYNGTLTTDASGKGSVTFTLPDDLTTWRVLAVAVSGGGSSSADWRFGGADTTFITSKPLLTNPVLPQFVRPGDRFEAGLSVTNTENQSGQLSIEGALSGPLQFDTNGQQSQFTTSTPAAQPGTQAYRFSIVATGLGKTSFRFTTKLGALSDAFEVPLELRTLPVSEGMVEANTTDDRATVPLAVDANVDTSLGGLDAELASILLPEFTARAKAELDEDEDLPFLEPIASQLLITANMQILATRYGQIYPDFHPVDAAARNVERLAKMQLPDGGFATWPGEKKSDPWTSPYAAEALARAQSAGLAVDASMLARLKPYLKKNIANPGRYAWCSTDLCKAYLRLRALIALADLGEPRNDFLGDIYDLRDRLDDESRIELARYLSRFPAWNEQATSLTDKLEQSVYMTGRYAAFSRPPGMEWFSSPTIVQAAALRLFVERNAPAELQDRLVRSLIDQRMRGSWPEYYDNAAALTALVDYSRAQPANANFTATLSVGGVQRASERFQGYRDPLRVVHVPMAQLPKGRSDIVLAKSGTGRLHYVVAYRYRLQGVSAGALNGLRVTRAVRLANQSNVLAMFGLNPPTGPLRLGAAKVYDIGLEVIADHPIDHLIISDPLPAGLEAVDTTFKTSTQYFQAIQGDNWQIDYQQIYKDRVVVFADFLEAGVYSFHYLARSVTPGTYAWPGAEVHLQYAPEEFGRTASSTLIVTR